MRNRKTGLLLFCFLFFIKVYSQTPYKAEEFQLAILKSKEGALIVYNGQQNSFTLKVIAKTIEATEQENFMVVDNKLMQTAVIPFTEKFDFLSLDERTEKELLNGYKAYEKEYVEEQLKMKLQEREEFISMDGRVFKYWSFDMPKDNDSVSKQVYLFTICFDQILMFNGPVVKNQLEQDLKTLLIQVARSLQMYPNKTQDLQKLYFELQN